MNCDIGIVAEILTVVTSYRCSADLSPALAERVIFKAFKNICRVDGARVINEALFDSLQLSRAQQWRAKSMCILIVGACGNQVFAQGRRLRNA